MSAVKLTVKFTKEEVDCVIKELACEILKHGKAEDIEIREVEGASFDVGMEVSRPSILDRLQAKARDELEKKSGPLKPGAVQRYFTGDEVVVEFDYVPSR